MAWALRDHEFQQMPTAAGITEAWESRVCERHSARQQSMQASEGHHTCETKTPTAAGACFLLTGRTSAEASLLATGACSHTHSRAQAEGAIATQAYPSQGARQGDERPTQPHNVGSPRLEVKHLMSALIPLAAAGHEASLRNEEVYSVQNTP